VIRLYQKIAELLRSRESFVLATIFDKTGSMPRSSGAKMIIRSDGSIFGTIGGGRLEAETVKLAGKIQVVRNTIMHSFDLTGNDAASMDMICGGKGEVLLDFIDAEDENIRSVYEAAVASLAQREKAWLITVLRDNGMNGILKRQVCLVKSDKTKLGFVECDSYLLEKILAGPAKISIHAEAFAGQRFLVEPLRPAGNVYIFGAGHVSQRIAPLSEMVGFRTVVVDDRIEYANRERFSQPTEIQVVESFRELPEFAIDDDSYLVIVTRGHLYDKVVLEQVLRGPAAYIGMIGSRSKRDLVYQQMMGQGYGAEELARVHAPIGTNIGAETPEELAVSIVGELIQVRAERENGKKIPQKAAGECCRIAETEPQ
jgi:xanthine dehydrogenase accessory factor